MKSKKRPNIKDIVADWLQFRWNVNEFDELPFDIIYKIVKKARPESRFNPQHLALYKSQFLKAKRDDNNSNSR